MRIVKDIVCIILLVFLPDFILEKMGLYNSMETIIRERMVANDVITGYKK